MCTKLSKRSTALKPGLTDPSSVLICTVDARSSCIAKKTTDPYLRAIVLEFTTLSATVY